MSVPSSNVRGTYLQDEVFYSIPASETGIETAGIAFGITDAQILQSIIDTHLALENLERSELMIGHVYDALAFYPASISESSRERMYNLVLETTD